MRFLQLACCIMLIVALPFASIAASEEITSIRRVQEKVARLLEQGVPSSDIVVIWDFHGVLTTQRMHEDVLTLNPEALDVLSYLKNALVAQVIATAWDDFKAVQKAVVSLRIAPFFDVNQQESPLKEIHLTHHSVSLQGHQNGKLVALKKPNDREKYFRRKAFAPECCFPTKIFKFVLFVDDTKYNIELFEQDFKEMSSDYENEPILYHLQASS